LKVKLEKISVDAEMKSVETIDDVKKVAEILSQSLYFLLFS
jgi:hypothetical protein